MLVALSAAPTAFSFDYPFQFITNSDSTITITGGGFTLGGALIIPAETNGYPVTSIQKNSYGNVFGGVYIFSVSIPGSVTNIGYAAFQGCSYLTNVQFGNGLLRIGNYAFQ